MRVKRSIVAALAAVVATIMLAACGGGSANAGGGNAAAVLNVGMPNGPQAENNNPFLETSAAASLGYRYVIYEPLVMLNRVKPQDPGKPWLATKWDWSDNYKKLVLTIRDGVKFSDGTPMTAEDVAYTFQLLRDNKALNIDSVPYKDITPSGNQVTLAFDSSQFVNQVKILQTIVVPKHIWSTIKDPTTDTVKNPVGTGPYTLKSFTPQTITVSQRTGYWQEAPKVKEIRYTSYNDNNAQVSALTSGAAEWSFVFIPNYKTVYVNKDPQHYKLWFPAQLAVHGLWFNTEKAPWNNATLRQAINKVINRDDIFNQGEAGYFYPKNDQATGIPSPAGDPFIAPQYKGQTVKVDVAAAKAQLTGAGFKLNGNQLVDPAGKPVTLKLSVPSGWSDYITDLEIIKDNLAQIGITATVDKMNQDAWTKSVDTGDFEGVLHWTNDGATPYDMYRDVMDGNRYKPTGQGGINGNYGRYKNDAATAALQTYANAADDASRATAMATLQQIMISEQPMIPLMAANSGGEYSTRNWTGWPDENNQYGPAQPTLRNALDIVLHLKPAA
ncbi:ABC transporter substrate-binding protein [Amycolatopsis saalfeldensis]|uniref:Peptide/nickel transport system substrate-binding protein n=1 Tax=Amycolatopsis saalfeldensis TaxID=394193 RepID=A0A1H8WNC5_9PSEU|nr:ABC transporter substrate-binding protein [Amycolatopsis saalfeldensis]SEP29126.1 peptide/nickel transport system substrate-binding protein [Amycolatopsis saalfeldensis]